MESITSANITAAAVFAQFLILLILAITSAIMGRLMEFWVPFYRRNRQSGSYTLILLVLTMVTLKWFLFLGCLRRIVETTIRKLRRTFHIVVNSYCSFFLHEHWLHYNLSTNEWRWPTQSIYAALWRHARHRDIPPRTNILDCVVRRWLYRCVFSIHANWDSK